MSKEKQVWQHKKYRVLGGGEIEGATPDELVKALMTLPYTHYHNEDEYIFATAERCRTQRGVEINCYNTEIFILDLLKYGFLEPIEEP